LAFLGSTGLALDLKSEFSPDKNPMLSGYGPLFRRTGTSLDLLANRAVEAGFMPFGSENDTDTLTSLIEAQLRGDKIYPLYGQDGEASIEQIAEERAKQDFEDAQAKQKAAEELQELKQREYDALVISFDADMLALPAINDQSSMSMEDALLSMGYTQEEANAEFIEQARIEEEASASIDGTNGTQAGTTPEGDGGRSSTPSSPTAARPADNNQPSSAQGLTAPTRQDVLDQQDRKDNADKAEAKAKADAEKKDKADREAAEIAQAGKTSADRFVLGGNAEDELSGQGGIFDQPAPEPVAPAPAAQSPEALRAQADLQNALADLGDIFGKNTRLNMLPEQEQKILPVLVKLFDAAFRLGYYKFKDAAKFALDKIRAALGDDVANALTLDQLQGAYISLGKREGGNSKREVINVEEKSEIENHVAKVDNSIQEQPNVPSTNAGVERDSKKSGTEPAVVNIVSDDSRGATPRTGETGGQASRGNGGGQQDGASVSPSRTPADRERSDQLIRGGGQPSGLTASDARTNFGERSGDSGITGIPPDAIAAEEVDSVASGGIEEIRNRAKQNAASKVSVEPGDLQNIRDTLPYLLPAQQEDVYKAETVFAKLTGYGMLFTNGTGTGKTFTGLGIVKRFSMQGKENTLILVPDNKIASDWNKSGKALGLDITQLDDTTQAGKGIVLTTYANLGANDALARRQWDLIVPDEAHGLMQNEKSEVTGALRNLRAITHHPDGRLQRFTMQNRADIDRYSEIDKQIIANNKIINGDDTMDVMRQSLQAENDKLEAKQNPLRLKLQKAREAVAGEVEAMQGAKRTRLVFLSATPFAYEKAVDWANGYLFDYMDGYPYDPQRAGLNYNQPDPFQYFMMTRFGYTMRVNKLNSPGPKVDSGLMQRQFNGELKKKGVLSGRMLDVKPDYDRRFVLIDSAIGNKIDEALEWLGDKAQAEAISQEKIDRAKRETGMSELASVIKDQFDYLSRRYLLEGIKAEAVIPIVKQHLALGRKVVVFHDYNKGGSINPFAIEKRTAAAYNTDEGRADAANFNKALAQFNTAFPELVTGLNDLRSPIEVFKKELPQTMLINGLEKQKDLLTRYLSFQEDANGPQVMLVQSDKNKGWSGHDTTGSRHHLHPYA
jgi:hypothetical protein